MQQTINKVHITYYIWLSKCGRYVNIYFQISKKLTCLQYPPVEDRDKEGDWDRDVVQHPVGLHVPRQSECCICRTKT